MTFWVSGIQSDLSDRIYIGHTDSLLRRIEEHNAGKVNSTKDQRPWKIIALEIFTSRKDARWRENCLKKSRGLREKWIVEMRLE
jgi:putative endonuclease